MIECEEPLVKESDHYYLHLPKSSYTWARLRKDVLDEEFCKCLKSSDNAPYFRAIATWIE